MGKHITQLDLFTAPATLLPPRDCTWGLVLQLPRRCRCSGQFASIDTGRGPHIASLICCKCGAHRGWVSCVTHAFLTEIIIRFGRPVVPIILRCTPQISWEDNP
jgi:hypothetical protein